MNKLIVSIILFACSVATFSAVAQGTADENECTMFSVHLKTGEVIHHKLPDQPVASFNGGAMQVKSDYAETEYPLEDIDHISFNRLPESMGIDGVEADGNAAFEFEYVDGQTVVVRSEALTFVKVFAIDGTEAAAVAVRNGEATVSLSGFANGIYIIATNCHPAIKVVKR